MKITRAADYAIRLLTYLASKGEESTTADIGEEINIPFNHLAKLVQILARRGYLITRKGKGGGLRLAVDPSRIDLAEVIEAVEGPMVISNCILHRKSCGFSAKCKTRKCLGRLKAEMRKLLSGTTIYDLVPMT